MGGWNSGNRRLEGYVFKLNDDLTYSNIKLIFRYELPEEKQRAKVNHNEVQLGYQSSAGESVIFTNSDIIFHIDDKVYDLADNEIGIVDEIGIASRRTSKENFTHLQTNDTTQMLTLR